MRVFISILFLLIFVAELTLDSSTIFVRSSSTKYSFSEDSGPASSSDSSESKKARNSTTRINVDSSVHSALPIDAEVSQFWEKIDPIISFADILIPCLNPPDSKIDRPPIC